MNQSPKSVPRGTSYEDIACNLLIRQGYSILYRNYRVIEEGFKGEIDVISLKDDVVFLDEVKKRSHFSPQCISCQQMERIWNTYRFFTEQFTQYMKAKVTMRLILVYNGEANILDIL